MLERNDIKSLRTFRYARINRIGSNSKRSNMDDRDFTAADDLFERPLVLARLASFLTDIKVSCSLTLHACIPISRLYTLNAVRNTHVCAM